MVYFTDGNVLFAADLGGDADVAGNDFDTRAITIGESDSVNATKLAISKTGTGAGNGIDVITFHGTGTMYKGYTGSGHTGSIIDIGSLTTPKFQMNGAGSFTTGFGFVTGSELVYDVQVRNLTDKSANETVSGNWGISGSWSYTGSINVAGAFAPQIDVNVAQATQTSSGTGSIAVATTAAGVFGVSRGLRGIIVASAGAGAGTSSVYISDGVNQTTLYTTAGGAFTNNEYFKIEGFWTDANTFAYSRLHSVNGNNTEGIRSETVTLGSGSAITLYLGISTSPGATTVVTNITRLASPN